MKKILHITNSFSEGGVDTFLLSFLPLLNKGGFDVNLLVLDKNEVALKDNLESKGVKVIIGEYTHVRDFRNIFFIYSILKKGNYDIVHAHLFPTIYFVSVLKLFFPFNAKFILTEHTCYNKRRGVKILQPLERLIYSQYNKIIGVSYGAKESLDKWINLNDKTITIPNGIDLDIFNNNISYTKSDLGLPANSKILIMVARFFKQKDHKTVIKALELLSDNIYLLFCGSGDKGIDECKILAQELKVLHRIRFLGNRQDINRVLKSVDIAILSTFYEGLPISIIETMASGLPTIASNVDGVREIIQDYGLLFEVGNYKELAGKISLLLQDNNYYNEVAKKCHERSTAFSIERMTNEYIKEYNKLCNKN